MAFIYTYNRLVFVQTLRMPKPEKRTSCQERPGIVMPVKAEFTEKDFATKPACRSNQLKTKTIYLETIGNCVALKLYITK
jgi:hypothetical protein